MLAFRAGLWKLSSSIMQEVDFIVCGEGENTMVDLVRCLDSGMATYAEICRKADSPFSQIMVASLDYSRVEIAAETRRGPKGKKCRL